MSRNIEHKTAQHRFEWTEDDTTSVLDYRLDGNVMTITHTGVPAALEGRGIAADLTRAALATAREQGWKVQPVCSYAHAFIKRHSEYQDLLAH